MQGTLATLDQPDRSLVEMARDGNKDAFGELIRRHYRRCIELSNLFLRNRCDAEDQVQIACSKAYMRLSQFHGDSEFSTWLLRIVSNECLMFIRGKRRARFVYLDDTSRQPEGAPTELPACGPDPEGELRLCELKQALKTELRRVPPLLRNVIMLRDMQELPMKDVADALNIGVPAAKSRLLRGRTELRARLVRRCENIESLSALSRSAAPLNRVAHHRAMHPVLTTDA